MWSFHVIKMIIQSNDTFLFETVCPTWKAKAIDDVF